MGKAGGLSPTMAAQLRQTYSEQIDQLDATLRDLHVQDEDLSRAQARSIKRRLLQIEKNAVRQRNLDGTISEEPMRRLLAELDEQLHGLEEVEDDEGIGG